MGSLEPTRSPDSAHPALSRPSLPPRRRLQAAALRGPTPFPAATGAGSVPAARVKDVVRRRGGILEGKVRPRSRRAGHWDPSLLKCHLSECPSRFHHGSDRGGLHPRRRSADSGPTRIGPVQNGPDAAAQKRHHGGKTKFRATPTLLARPSRRSPLGTPSVPNPSLDA